jgi:prevent-host-death family protein
MKMTLTKERKKIKRINLVGDEPTAPTSKKAKGKKAPVEERVQIADFRRDLKRYLDRANEGETIYVIRNDKPIAKLVPLQ